jgi:hypothetical protein
VAKQFDMSPGKAPNAVVSYEEQIDISFADMTGNMLIKSSAGTLTDTAAKVNFRAEVRKALTCERRPFTPPGSTELR